MITGYCSRTCSSSSRKKSGCKIRYHFYHVIRTGGSRDNRSLWSVSCNALTFRKATGKIMADFKSESYSRYKNNGKEAYF